MPEPSTAQWVQGWNEALPFQLSRVKVTQLYPTLCDPMDYGMEFHGLWPWNSPGQNTGVGSHSLLQGIFLTQGSNPSLPHCRWIIYQLRHQESPRILEWVAYPFSSRSFQPRNRTGVSCIAAAAAKSLQSCQADSLPTEL